MLLSRRTVLPRLAAALGLGAATAPALTRRATAAPPPSWEFPKMGAAPSEPGTLFPDSDDDDPTRLALRPRPGPPFVRVVVECHGGGWSLEYAAGSDVAPVRLFEGQVDQEAREAMLVVVAAAQGLARAGAEWERTYR